MVRSSTASNSSEPVRIDDVLVRLRRLVDSSEPAIVFSSLVRLCVPLFCDAAMIDIVEGGRVRYRIAHPQPLAEPGPQPSDHEVVTTFESELPGWPSYTGVMRSRWHARVATEADDARAAAIVAHAIRLIRSERLADPVRSGLGSPATRRERRSTHR